MESLVSYQPSSYSFIDLIEKAFETYTSKPCVRFRGVDFTYSDVDKISFNIASDLIRKGFKKGV